MSNRVFNFRTEGLPDSAVYIGRKNPRKGLPHSIWANPFAIGKDGTRAEVIDKYRTYILANPDLLSRLPELNNKDLVCWCAPLPCHGNVLVELSEISSTL